MMNVSIDADPASLAKFNATLEIVLKNTGQKMPQLVAGIGRMLCYYAIKSTPIENEKQMTIPPAPAKDRTTGKYIEAPADADPDLRLISGRGFAKSGWARAMKELGGKASAVAHGIPAAEFGGLEASKSNETATLQFFNRVPYIEDLQRGSKWNTPNDIMTKAVNQSRKDVERQIKRWGAAVAKSAGFNV
jgi:hypothetical protein